MRSLVSSQPIIRPRFGRTRASQQPRNYRVYHILKLIAYRTAGSHHQKVANTKQRAIGTDKKVDRKIWGSFTHSHRINRINSEWPVS